MSVEQKIKNLLSSKEQLVEETQEDLTTSGMADTGAQASAKMKKDTSKASTASVAGDTTQPMQGDSKKAEVSSMDEDETNLGSKAAAAVSKDSTLPKNKGDAKTVKTQAMEETEAEEEQEVIAEVDVKTELSSIFGEDLSEEFKNKATSIFEAAVIARVNSEMEKITDKLEEQNSVQLQEYKETLVEKVDTYLSYVVEQWMQENEIAINNGLRSEITEEFITGLKVLFKESYIDVPEEKYDVIEELTSKVEELSAKLDESIEDNIEISKQYVELRKQSIIKEQISDLADTEAEKFTKLIEGVDYDSDELFNEKLSVIKENYFPKEVVKSAEQVLVEESGLNTNFEEDSVMSRYASAISRTVKSR